MIADDIITEVTEPTDWIDSIICNVKDTPDGKKKVQLCLDPKDLNKNICREHYYSRTIDEILPLLHGKKYFLVVDITKGYWHVELDDDSSLLCTFNILNVYHSALLSPRTFFSESWTTSIRTCPMLLG